MKHFFPKIVKNIEWYVICRFMRELNEINKLKINKMKRSILGTIVLALGLIVFLGNTADAQTYKYIGAVKCKMCHNKPTKGEQYNVWAKGPHAKAMESLTGDDATNPKCLKCHSTAHSVDKGLHMGIKATEGVSCESCHGPGSVYKSMSIMKDQAKSLANGLILPDEKVCKACHNEESPTFKGFNYDEYVKKIEHDDPLTK